MEKNVNNINNEFFNSQQIQEMFGTIENNNANSNKKISKKDALLKQTESLIELTREMQRALIKIKVYEYKDLINRKEESLKILKNSEKILGINLNSQSSEQLKEKLNKILNANLPADSILNLESITKLQKDLEELLGTKLSLDDILQLKENFNTILEITIHSQTMDYLQNSFENLQKVALNLLSTQQNFNNLIIKDNVVNEENLSKAKNFMKDTAKATNKNLNNLYGLYYDIKEKVEIIEELAKKIKPLQK